MPTNNNPVFAGTTGTDTLAGGGLDQVIYGDQILTLAADAAAFAGGASDTIDGAAGADTIFGQGGDDVLQGGDNAGSLVLIGATEFLYGGVGNDTLRGGTNNPSRLLGYLDGGSGDDVVVAGSAQDRLLGGAGNDTLQAGTGTTTVLGGDGIDTLVLHGGPGDYGFSLLDGTIQIDGIGGGATEGTIIAGQVERIAFGITADQLADGVAPTMLDSVSHLLGLPNTPPVAVVDTVTLPRDATTVTLNIADLLANDGDPDLDPVAFNAMVDAPAFTSWLSDGAGHIVLELVAPLTTDVTVQYTIRTTTPAATSLPADIILHPAASVPLAADDSVTISIGQTVRIPLADLLANDVPGVSIIGSRNILLPGGSVQDVLSSGYIEVTDSGTAPRLGGFDYQVTDGSATATAHVTLNVTNHVPVAPAFTVSVVPGGSVTLTVDQIVNHAGTVDPDGDALALWALGNPIGATAHVTTVATLDNPGPSGRVIAETYSFDAGYTGGALVNYGITDGHLGGITFSSFSFVVVSSTPPTVSITGSTDATEGTLPGSGGVLVFHLGRSGDLSAATTVDYRIGGSDGGNPAGADDLAGGFGTGSVTFAAGQDHLDIALPIAPDAMPEPDERVQLDLLTVTGGGYGSVLQSSAVILNDDGPVLPPPQVSVTGGDNAVEGTPPGAGGTLSFHLSRSGDLSGTTTVEYLVGSSPFGTSAAADDLASGFGHGSASFAVGQDSAVVTVAIAPDSTLEPDEQVQFSLLGITGAGSLGSTLQATANILDDDETTVSISHTTSAFENSSSISGGVLYYDIARTGDLGVTTTVTAYVGPGSAQADDLQDGFHTEIITFAPGQAMATLWVFIHPDSTPEPDETVALSLNAVTGGRLGPTTTANATILDDDHRSVVTVLSGNTTPEGTPPGPGGTGGFTLTRTGDLTDITTVTYSLGGAGTTATPDDVQGGFADGSVTFAVGQREATVPLTWVPDATREPNEKVALTLTGATNGMIGPHASDLATIADDDVPPPSVVFVQQGNRELPEGTTAGQGAVFTFVLKRIGDLVDAQTASYVFEPLSETLHNPFGPDTTSPPATADDFTGGFGAGTVDFAIGQDTVSVTVQAVPDTVPEGDETFRFTLTGVTGGSPGATIGQVLFDDRGIAYTNQLDDTGTILNDDSALPPPSPSTAGPTPYNDLLIGGPGDDTLDGGLGDDTLMGAAGRDVAVFNSTKVATSLARNADGSWTATGPDGVDVLHDMEVARFSDGDRPLATAPSDMQGRGISDLVFQHSGGTLARWSPELDQTLSVTGLGACDPAATAVAVADVTGDGLADVIVRGDAGDYTLWQTEREASPTVRALGSPGSGATFFGTGDLNGDGTDDIVFRTGDTLSAWIMQNGTIVATSTVGITDGAWTAVGFGDVNGDATDDVIFTSAAGDVAAWLVSDGQATAGKGIGTLATGWRFAALGDLDADGQLDLAFEHTSGAIAAWRMHQGDVVQSSGIGDMASGWSISGAGDINGDGTTDLLFRHGSGTIAAWAMQDGQIGTVIGLGSTTADWSLV